MLREALEANGQRVTDQRAAVYRFLLGTTDHPTADEVFTAVRGDIADISLATVYKALETLVICNLAVKLTYGDDSARYDARTDDHYHSRCVRCGQVRDVPGEVHDRQRPTTSTRYPWAANPSPTSIRGSAATWWSGMSRTLPQRRQREWQWSSVRAS